MILLGRAGRLDLLTVLAGDVAVPQAVVQELGAGGGFAGQIRWNSEMPDGTPRKLLAVDRLTELGWWAKTLLVDRCFQGSTVVIDSALEPQGIGEILINSVAEILVFGTGRAQL